MMPDRTRKATACRIILAFSLLCTASFALPEMESRLPEVDIAEGPLLGIRGNVHPNMVLSLASGPPITGIAYRAEAGAYDRTVEYIGYFNSRKCYVYQGGNRNIVDGYFAIAKKADQFHECGGQTFSGNFMNWAALSAIDIIRYALTGGDRVVDTEGVTILQRAVLHKGMYAHETYFPRRVLAAGAHASTPSRVTPFKNDPLFIVSCSNRILFSDSINSANDCDTPAFDHRGRLAKTDKRLGEFLVRVKVCDAKEGPHRTDLCQRFGRTFKPVGEMQRHAGKIRFAVMGYLADNAKNRYGGVLRAPMKYIGTRKFAEPGFTESSNEYPEWDPATGVLFPNPDDQNDRHNSSVHSGAINYVNKVGRSGDYKLFNPLSELHYEAIRYLQGKPPTPDATRGMTDAMKDNFQVVKAWSDPITASCQRNYIVAVADTDIDQQWDHYIPGNGRTVYDWTGMTYDLPRPAEPAARDTPPLDATTWTRKVGDLEADISGSYANPSPRVHLQGLQDKAAGYRGSGSYFIAGLAYWAKTNDIRDDKPVRVNTFSIDIDLGGNGSIDKSNRLIKPRDSQLYLAAKYGGFNDTNGDGNPYVTSSGSGITRGDNMEWEQDGSGVPAGYMLASQPWELVRSIRKMFQDASGIPHTVTASTVSETAITSDAIFLYQAAFDSRRWSGSLKKFRATLRDAGGIDIARTADWDAAEILTGTKTTQAFPVAKDRRIYVGQYDSRSTFSAVPFHWAELNGGQRAALNLPSAQSVPDGLGERRVNYLRGERSLELGQPGGMFRVRDSIVGDIINSHPVYVRQRSALETSSADDVSRAGAQGRIASVYVGANDGMLHAFDAVNGTELFSYIPDALLRRLPRLTSPDYEHQPYVDGALTVANVTLAGRHRTILASGMGGGAQGVFALDVSDPSHFGTTSALWEFTDRDDPDVGNILGAPAIAKFRTGMVKGVAAYKYFVVIPSGVNHYRDDGSGKFSETGQGALFLLSLDKPRSVRWKLGKNYFKFKLPVPMPYHQNGVAPPALVVGTDGAVQYAYAGDFQGNMWRFDFTGSAPWKNAMGADPAAPLFIAQDDKGERQQITVQPKAVFAPGGGYQILFGTGKYIEASDTAPGGFKTQSFYAILDPTTPNYRIGGRGALTARILAAKPGEGMDAFQVSIADPEVNALRARGSGWYVDFVDSHRTGERLVTTPVIAHRHLFFNTFIPGSDSCSEGMSRTYMLDALTGFSSTGALTGYLSGLGLMSMPLVIEEPAEVGGTDPVGRRKVKKRVTILNSGKDGTRETIVNSPNGRSEFVLPAGRLSWREIINWQELHDAATKK